MSSAFSDSDPADRHRADRLPTRRAADHEHRSEPSPPPRGVDATADPLPALAAVADDDRLLRRAIAVAIVFHAVLFLVHFPGSNALAEIAPPERKVYVLRQDRFRPPEPDRPRELPEPRTRRVPVPDPTPDAPEPLRVVAPETFDLVPADVVLAVPESAPEPPGDPAPRRLTSEMVRPVKLHAPMPEYTEIARRARIQGVVILEAVIEVDGSVRDVTVLRGLPMGLSEAAVRAVEGWRYRPALLSDQPVAVILSVSVDFRLQ